MALLIDEAAPFDVEIIDDWMFVYSQRAFRTGDANHLRAAVPHHRHRRREDADPDRPLRRRARRRLPANIVAPQGARLKRGVSVGAIVIGVVFAAFWAVGILSKTQPNQ